MAVLGVHAQSSLPEFSLGGTLSDIDSTDDVVARDYDIKTKLMSDILVLHEQINLLEALVERQSEIEKIADSYDDVGLFFKQPAPSEQACEKLPVNLLCLYSYPDMDKNMTLVEEQKERIQQQQQQAMNDAIAELMANNQAFDLDIDDSFDGDMREFLPAQLTVKDRFSWSDIQCFMNNCSALIVSSNDSAQRYRVSEGDVFEDGIKVEGVNANGVQVALDGTDYFLSPTPLSSSPTERQNDRQTGQIANLIDRQMGMQATPPQPDILRGLETSSQDAASTTPAPTEPLNSSPSNSSSNGELLGPTGLF